MTTRHSAFRCLIQDKMLDASASAWQSLAENKRRQCQSLIPDTWLLPSTVSESLPQPLEKSRVNLIEHDIPRRSGILTSKELEITEAYDVERLLKALASGALTALEVTLAFCKRAAIAQQLVSITPRCPSRVRSS